MSLQLEGESIEIIDAHSHMGEGRGENGLKSRREIAPQDRQRIGKDYIDEVKDHE